MSERRPGHATGDGLVMFCDVDLNCVDATRTHTLEVARGFAAEGLTVDLVSRGADPRLPGVRYHSSRFQETQHIRRMTAANLRAMQLLWARRHSARRAYVRFRWSNVPTLVVARLLGYRLVVQVDDIPFGRGYGAHIARAEDYLKRLTVVATGALAHGIVAVTMEIKRILVQEYRVPAERVTVLRNGVDTQFFRPAPRAEAAARSQLDPALRYVVFVGSFQPWVDFDTLLEAFSLVSSEHPDTRLLLVGDGDERARVERKIRELKLDGVVLITGYLSDRARVRDLVSAATVTVASHRREYVGHIGVSPTKVAEYLAAGRPVVAMDVPGLREALEHTGAGLVATDAQSMAAAIVRLLDPQRSDRFGANGRRLAEESYDWRSVVKRTLPLFGLSGVAG